MAENLAQEGFIHEWLAELLTALPEQIPQTILPSLFKGCADIHYRHADIEAFVTPYIGKLDAFLQALSEQWHWKISYNPTNHTITADENKDTCVCPLVQTHLDMPATLCYCSERFAENMFSIVAKTPVKATVIRSILRGDSSCIYQIRIV